MGTALVPKYAMVVLQSTLAGHCQQDEMCLCVPELSTFKAKLLDASSHRQIRKKERLGKDVLPKDQPFESGSFVSVELLGFLPVGLAGLESDCRDINTGQAQTLPQSKTNLLPIAHPWLFCIKVSEITARAPEEISMSGERISVCLREENKAQSIPHPVGITG